MAVVPYVVYTEMQSKNYELIEFVVFAKMNSTEKRENLPHQFAFAMAKLFCKPANEPPTVCYFRMIPQGRIFHTFKIKKRSGSKESVWLTLTDCL